MTAFAALLDRLCVAELPSDPGHPPLGAAWLSDARRGVDLAAHGYVEQELLVRGEADRWTWDETLAATSSAPAGFCTRILVRRPADLERFSGGVQLEAMHPEHDTALGWGMIAPWIVASGHAHVAVTQDPKAVEALRAFDPDRYAMIDVGDGSLRFDVIGLVAAALVDGRVPGLDAPSRIVLSGWSNTGTFCRTFLGEGFHERCRTASGPVFSGYVVCISSGGAITPGYASPPAARTLPIDDPRRTIGAHGVPIVELLSEGEGETHGPVLRDDSDGPDDLYRLYEIAGTGHIVTGTASLLTNRAQTADRGLAVGAREIEECPSDARMDTIARSVYALLDRWITDGVAPPRAPRFRFADPACSAPRGARPEAVALARDADGNVIGGVRPPWIELPLASYLPHSTPSAGRCAPGPGAPYTDPRLLADLIAHRVPFDAEDRRRRYGSAAAYMTRFTTVAERASRGGWIWPTDLDELRTTTRASCGDW